MKKLYAFIALWFLMGGVFAQTQQGFVKTKGRMDAKGNLIPGQGLKGAIVSIKGRTAVLVNADDGAFSFPVTGTQFRLDSVKKKGYQLIDVESCPKTYERSSNPLYIVMETPDQQLQDKLNAERKIRRNLQKQLQAKEDEIEALREENKISMEAYQLTLQQLYAEQESNEQLIKDMARHYSELDYDQLDEFYRQVSYCIENGELVKADSLLRTKGDVTLQVEEQLRKGQALKEREEQLNQAKTVHVADMEELAKRCYSYYETFAAQHLNDTAAYYLELRASLDTTNVLWTEEAGDFIRNYIADYPRALTHLQRGLRNSMAQFGEQSEKTAAFYYQLSILQDYVGNYDEAIGLGNKALSIYQTLFGEEHPEIANVYIQLGGVYFELGDYDKALEYNNKAIAIQIKVFGEKHPDVAYSYTSIGQVFCALGEYRKALEYHEKALLIILKVYGEEHSETQWTYNNLGQVYCNLGEYDKALECFRDKALPISLKVFGETHPDVAFSYNNVGSLYFHLGEYDKALESFNKALSIWIKVQGEEHDNVAWAYDNIGMVYSKLGRYEEALAVLNKSVVIYEGLFGEDHPYIATSYDHLGVCYGKLGNYAKALEYLDKALTIKKNAYGEEHPYLGNTYMSLCLIYNSQKDYAKAVEYGRKALSFVSLVKGEDHPDVVLLKEKIAELEAKIIKE